MKHVSEELNAFHLERKYSITWSVQEATFLVRPFLDQSKLTNYQLARRAIGAVPLLLVEEDESRHATSLDELRRHEEFWTVDGKFYESAENLLREVPTAVSLRNLVSSLGSVSLKLPPGLILCQDPWNNEIQEFAFRGREPKGVKMDHAQRRLDIQWGNAGKVPNWRNVVPDSVRNGMGRAGLHVYHGGGPLFRAKLALKEIPVDGIASEIGFQANGHAWIFATSPISQMLNLLADGLARPRRPRETQFFLELLNSVDHVSRYSQGRDQLVKLVGRLYEEYPKEATGFMARSELLANIEGTEFRIFDPSVWVRS